MSRLAPIERWGLLHVVEDDVDVVPGVTMLHAPGETPGHCIVRVESQTYIFYALGDLFHHPCQVQRPDWTSASRDRSSMETSRKRVLADAVETGATIVAHSPFPPWGRIVRRHNRYRWQTF
jgi:glyoxylase-like metal-dependent hydrolase (beta-lactamase superfamily II)